MTILQPFIDSTHFEQAQPLWNEGLAQDVFELFFACIFANMSRQIHYVQYQRFVDDTKEAFEMSMEGAYAATPLFAFWDSPAHTLMQKKIAETVLINSDELSAVLPLALHTAMAVLHTLSGQQGLTVPEWINQHLSSIATYLPSWADEVVDKAVLARLNVEQMLAVQVVPPTAATPNANITKNSLDANNASISHAKQFDEHDNTYILGADNTNQPNIQNSKSNQNSLDVDQMGRLRSTPKRQGNPWLVAVPMLAALLLVAAGGYYYLKQKEKDMSAADKPALAVQSLPPSQLSITVKGQGELYACHAKVGSSELSQQLITVIQANFAHTLCVIDVDESLSKELSLDKLTSILALLQTVPYATFEQIGSKAYINAPNSSDVSRLVADIGALIPSVQVLPMPALNADAATQDSIRAATDALNALPANPDDFALARAMSLQVIDTAKGGVPEINQAVLKLAGERLKASANTRLLVVAHSDDSGDLMSLRAKSQIVADAIKNALIGYGASDGQLTAIGVGADFPLADNQTELGRFKNRRVEFLVYDEATLQALNQAATTSYDLPTNNEDLPVFEVVDGQIVQKDSTAVEYLPDGITTNAVEGTHSASPSPTTTVPPANNVQTIPAYDPSIPVYTPVPSAAAPSSGGIDEDLLRPLGSEPFRGTAVEIQP